MDIQPETLPQDVADFMSEAQLRGSLRELLSILALPTLLNGKKPADLVEILAGALEHLFGTDACYVRAPLGLDAPVLEALRVSGGRADAGEGEWAEFKELHGVGLASDSSVGWADTPIGRLRVVRITMNYASQAGVIFLGSREASFPDPKTAVLIRAAASLAGNAMSTASATYEREQALRAKDEFLAMLGHELRNPLAPIASVIGIMEIRGGGKLPREMQIIQRQVRHLTGLVDDLLDIAKVTRGKPELNCKELEIFTIAAQAVEMSRPLIEQRRHELTIAVPATGLRVRVDQRRLAQVVSNLLINAAKYTPEGGRIYLWARSEGNEVRVGVRDNGVGIDGKLLPRVFDMFYQVHGSQDRSGLGIGLALVKSLVELHGGHVHATSGGTGFGSEFVVALPLVAADPSADGGLSRAASTGQAGSTVPQRILLVDDNKDAALTMEQLLELAGHEVTVAHDAASALWACERVRPSIALVDIGLPGVDGYQLAQLIRERMGANAPRLVALGGYALDIDVQHSTAAGFEAHIAKPVAPERLVSLLAGQ